VTAARLGGQSQETCLEALAVSILRGRDAARGRLARSPSPVRSAGRPFFLGGDLIGHEALTTNRLLWIVAAASLALASCDRRQPTTAEQNGVATRPPAQRVVSLVPSMTDAIVALNAADRLVGRTRYDTAPQIAELPSVGGGLDPSLEALISLEPDLVIGWESAEYRGLRSRLEAGGIAFHATSIEDTTDVFRSLDELGMLLDLPDRAATLAAEIRESLAAVSAAGLRHPKPTVFYALLGDPPRTAGRRTFVGQLIEVAGGAPAFGELEDGWPEVSLEAVLTAQPDIVVVPADATTIEVKRAFAEQPGWRDLNAVREGRIVVIPTDLLNRPGPHVGSVAKTLHTALVDVWGAP
jgi:iron complex transport system substrate-binding protein